jgi:hypothetical protein
MPAFVIHSFQNVERSVNGKPKSFLRGFGRIRSRRANCLVRWKQPCRLQQIDGAERVLHVPRFGFVAVEDRCVGRGRQCFAHPFEVFLASLVGFVQIRVMLRNVTMNLSERRIRGHVLIGRGRVPLGHSAMVFGEGGVMARHFLQVSVYNFSDRHVLLHPFN